MQLQIDKIIDGKKGVYRFLRSYACKSCVKEFKEFIDKNGTQTDSSLYAFSLNCAAVVCVVIIILVLVLSLNNLM
jgi:hypothetical protein